eukprot:1550686-Pyramimonas_sp.AAC.1
MTHVLAPVLACQLIRRSSGCHGLRWSPTGLGVQVGPRMLPLALVGTIGLRMVSRDPYGLLKDFMQ